MSRPALEIADIFRNHGPAWRREQAGRLSLGQLKVMSAIERCRTAALGGHVAQCADCAHSEIAYNSCRAVLAYLSRYTHRVAIANSRLIRVDAQGVTFQFKDYRAKGRCRYRPMTLPVAEFMRRFLLHVLPCGFHRIRHYGLLANASRVANLARARELLAAPLSPLIAVPVSTADPGAADHLSDDARR